MQKCNSLFALAVPYLISPYPLILTEHSSILVTLEDTQKTTYQAELSLDVIIVNVCLLLPWWFTWL